MTSTGEYGRYTSPPCLAGEIAPDTFDSRATDPEQARDLARWRRAERVRLRKDRQTLSVEARAAAGTALTGLLGDLLSAQFHGARCKVVSAYWPIKGEPDLRPLVAGLHAADVIVSLPLVERKAAPLVFRRWTPDTAMVLGDWNIPIPPSEAEALTPDITLAPLVGWDCGGFRLGYGGGYFDRTLEALVPQRFTIGIGFQSAKLTTIFPQPHDIPLNMILTEMGAQVSRERQ